MRRDLARCRATAARAKCSISYEKFHRVLSATSPGHLITYNRDWFCSSTPGKMPADYYAFRLLPSIYMSPHFAPACYIASHHCAMLRLLLSDFEPQEKHSHRHVHASTCMPFDCDRPLSLSHRVSLYIEISSASLLKYMRWWRCTALISWFLIFINIFICTLFDYITFTSNELHRLSRFDTTLLRITTPA